MLRLLFATALVVGVLGLTSCDSAVTPPEEPDHTYSFEDGLQGWEARGTDLMMGDGETEIEWDVEHEPEVGNEAPGSVHFFLENDNDAGKIWMERSFSLEPNSRYAVRVNFAFGSSDWGNINLWTIIAGVHQNSPETRDDLTYQGDTGNGADEDVGLVWLKKDYTFTAETDGSGELYVAIGVWGTWETARTYHVDDLHIAFEPQ